MPQLNKLAKKQSKLYRSLVATILLFNGFFQLIAPVLAEGTAAGQQISNTATGTYEDPNNPGTTINTTSNTVVVTVAEVAGITVTGSGVIDNTPADPVKVGDILYYNYTITNVGNDPTKFRIPNLARSQGPGTVGNLEYSTDGGKNWTPISNGEYITDSIPVGGSISVRVPVTVQPGAQPNQEILVTLGNTPGDAQNQLRSPDGGDVYTVDNPDNAPAPEVPGAPINGVREASATQKAIVNQSLKNYTLATLFKVRNDYNNAGTPAINDDKLTYGLSFKVEQNDPTGNEIIPAPLVGSSMTLDNAPATRILVSDAIPAGTELAIAPTPPPNWQVVYSEDNVSIDANQAKWTTSLPPGGLSAVKRVGFVNTSVITSIAPGTTVNGFTIQLKVTSTATSLAIANIAQLFGTTPDNDNDPTNNPPVYDESGDQNPSNYDGPPGNMTPPPGTDTNGDKIPDSLPDTAVDDGYVNTPTNPEQGSDTSNNNSGSGPGGEANIFEIKEPVNGAILNGPKDTPDAVGPTDNNDDFTNKSSFVPPNLPAGKNNTLDPSPVGFTNTIKNSGTNSGVVTLEPQKPGNIKDLPNGTVVTITYNQDSVSYKYDDTTGNFTVISSTTGGKAIAIPNVDPNKIVNYGVEVNLPEGTPLSTDIDRGFPVPIKASIDNYTIDTNNDGIKDSGNDNTPDAFNITIDRVYTGYLKMVKESRVLPGTGPAVQGNDGTFSTEPKKPAPGNIIEYQIRYKNISEAQAGSGNVVLKADKVVIVEDGTLSTTPGDGKNNWALDNDSDGQIDTSNVVGTAKDSGAATLQFYSGNPATNSGIDQSGTTVNTDITKYVNTVTGSVTPGEERKFSFQRKVNNTSPTGTAKNGGAK